MSKRKPKAQGKPLSDEEKAALDARIEDGLKFAFDTHEQSKSEALAAKGDPAAEQAWFDKYILRKPSPDEKNDD